MEWSRPTGDVDGHSWNVGGNDASLFPLGIDVERSAIVMGPGMDSGTCSQHSSMVIGSRLWYGQLEIRSAVVLAWKKFAEEISNSVRSFGKPCYALGATILHRDGVVLLAYWAGKRPIRLCVDGELLCVQR